MSLRLWLTFRKRVVRSKLTICHHVEKIFEWSRTWERAISATRAANGFFRPGLLRFASGSRTTGIAGIWSIRLATASIRHNPPVLPEGARFMGVKREGLWHGPGKFKATYETEFKF